MAKTKVVICPYCGSPQTASEQCRHCRGSFDPLSRRATHNEMGPWAIRDPERPFRPGCSYETLVRLVERGDIDRTTVMRGPTTRQFWTVARRVPGVAHLLGYCHACDAHVDEDAVACPNCQEPFGAYLDRDFLGLPDVQPLPGTAPEDSAVGHVAVTTTVRPLTLAPRGISSFGTDDELMASPAAVSTSAAAGETSGTATETQSPLEAALRRRVFRLERTVRVLAVLLVLSMIATGVCVAVWGLRPEMVAE